MAGAILSLFLSEWLFFGGQHVVASHIKVQRHGVSMAGNTQPGVKIEIVSICNPVCINRTNYM